MRLHVVQLAILAIVAPGGLIPVSHGQEAAPNPPAAAPQPTYVRQLTAPVIIPELPAGDPHHAVMLQVRETMAKACATCHAPIVSRPTSETLGLSLTPADAALREQLGLEKAGLVVNAVEPKSRAAVAGIEPNDILVRTNEKALMTIDAFKAYVKELNDAPMNVDVFHDGAKKTVTIPPPPPPKQVSYPSYGFGPGELPKGTPSHFWIGVSINPASEPMRSQLKLPDGTGLVVSGVVEGSPAAKAGIKVNDVLVAAGDTPLKAVEDLVKSVQTVKERGALVVLRLRHAGQEKTIDVKPEERKDIRSTLQNGPIGRINILVQPDKPTARAFADEAAGLKRLDGVETMFIPNQPPLVVRYGPTPLVTPDGRSMIANPLINRGIYPDIAFTQLKPIDAATQVDKLNQIETQLKELTKQMQELKASMSDLGRSLKEKPKDR